MSNVGREDSRPLYPSSGRKERKNPLDVSRGNQGAQGHSGMLGSLGDTVQRAEGVRSILRTVVIRTRRDSLSPAS